MVHIVADTLSSIPVDEAKRINLPYLPQIIVFGEQSFRDDSEIDSETFLQKLVTSKELPKTAAPSPALYDPIFEILAKTGEPILVICPSSKVSGTVRSAEVAAQNFPNTNIHVLDTPLIGAGLGVLVKKALEWAKEGMEIIPLINNINELATRNRTYFLLDTLEYLRRGGRIGTAKALMGGILQVKPLLTFRNGQVEPVESQRTKTKALSRLIEIVVKECPHDKEAFLCVQEGGEKEEALRLAEEFKNQMNLLEVPMYTVPPAILVHGGPNVLGVSYFVK